MTLPTILLIAACVAVAIGGWAYCSAVADLGAEG